MTALYPTVADETLLTGFCANIKIVGRLGKNVTNLGPKIPKG